MTTAKALPHVAVLKGGWSAEREVSLVSGRACAEALRREGHRVTEIDVGRDIGLVLGEIAPDVAFNAMHGPYGEDGSIQGVLEVLGIPYTHSGVLASAIAMDKDKAKIVFRAAGLPCAESLIATRQAAAGGHLMEPPYVVKPVNQGSSVGVFIVHKGDNRPPELLADPSWSLGDQVMVERFVPGRELTVAVLEDRPLGVTEIIARSQFYDYDAKYKQGGSKHVLPADVPPAIYRRACDLAVEAHRVLGCRGVSRADFRYDEAGTTGEDLVLLEVNTQPGMTPTSLAPEQAVHAGMTFDSLCRWLVEDASCQR